MSDNIFIQPVKVAVIDDNIEFCLGMKLLLAKEGVEIYTAADGLEGLEMVNRFLPDIVLLDVVIPGLDGIEVCKKIRQSPALKGAYIVMLSGLKTQSDQMSEGLEAGADDYITRPIPNRELLARLRSFIRLKKAEKALKVREDKLSKILQAANDGMWDWDLKTNQVYFDTRYYQMSGYDVDEFPHNLNEFQKRVHAEDIDYVMSEAEKHLKGMVDRFDVKFRFRKKSGDWQWIQGKGIIVERNKEGVPQRFVGTHRDISDLKQVEEALRSNFTLLRIAGETARFGGWSVDLEKNTSTWSDIVADIHEVPHGYATPVHEGIQFYAPEWREKITQVFDNCARKGIPYDEEMEIITAKGKRLWVRTIGRAVKDELGKIRMVQGAFQDITVRKQAEKKLRESEEKYRTLVNSTLQGVVIAKANPIRLVYANPAMSQISGYSTESLIEMAPEELMKLIDQEDQQRFFSNFQKRIQGENINQESEYRMKTKEGTIKWIALYSSLIEYQNEAATLTTFMDITSRKQAEEDLRKSEENLAITLNSIGDGVISTDIDGLIVKMNPVAENLCGWKLTDALGKPLTEVFKIVNDITRETAIDPVKKVLENGEIVGMANHTVLISRNGNEYQIADSAAPIKNKEGKTTGVVLVFSDVTEKYAIQKQIRESEERYKALHNASFGGIAIHDKGLILECNHGLSEITGFSYDELIGMDGLLLIAPESRDMVMANILAGYEKPYEAVGLRKNGELYPIRLEARNIPYKGKAVRTVEFRDITESKRTLEALQRIEWMLSKKKTPVESVQVPQYGDLSELNANGLILGSVGKNVLEDIANDSLRLLETSSAVYEKNGDYALGIFSSGWCRFMDQASRELCNTDDNTEALNCGKWLCHDSCWKEASLPAIESGQPVDVECQGGIHLYALPIIAGGEVVGAINFGYGDPPQDRKKLRLLAEKYKVPLDDLLKKAKEYESRPYYIIETAKDRLQASANLIGEIVRRKTVEKEILKLNEKLEERITERTAQLEASNKELEAFSYSVSHDLRAPLRHINGFVELLKEEYHDGLPEKAKYYLSNVSDATRQMGKLIEDLLQFSRTGRQEVQKAKIEMNELVKEVVESLMADSPKRLINWHIQKLPQVFGDYSLLKMVWTNLLENAAKFSLNREPAEIYIGFKEEKKTFVFFIKDNGVGFEMKYAHKLFGVFQRLHSLDEFEGTGIGLAHVQRIIHKHNGQVWAEAEPGIGATFFFSLPKHK